MEKQKVKYKCENCGDEFDSITGYNNHRQKFIRTGSCENICVHCGEVLNNKVAVSRHKANYKYYGVCRRRGTYKYVSRKKPKRVTLAEIENHWT